MTLVPCVDMRMPLACVRVELIPIRVAQSSTQCEYVLEVQENNLSTGDTTLRFNIFKYVGFLP